MIDAEPRQISLQETIGKGYADFWRNTQRYRVCKGSRGSKKSKTTALNLVFRMMQMPLANSLVVRRTFETLKDSCYSDLKWAMYRLGVAHLWKCTTSPLRMTYRPTGQVILFRGFDDPLKVTSISVPKGVLCWVWIEEAYEVTKEADFNKLDLSIRGTMPDGYFKQFTFTFNPWSAQSWLKKRFFDVPDDDIFTKTTTYECNEWLDDADRKIFEKMKINNPRRYNIEGLGDWGIAEGLIYENTELEDFDVNALFKEAANQDARAINEAPTIKACYGLDFGFTDPTAFVAAVIDENTDTIYICDEIYKRGMTNKDIAEELHSKGYGDKRIICDSAEPKSIEELRSHGVIYAEGSRKGKDSVLHGIQAIQNYKVVVNPRCVNVWHEISNYCWDVDKFNRPTDKPNHDFSHSMDALRYGVARQLTSDRFSFK